MTVSNGETSGFQSFGRETLVGSSRYTTDAIHFPWPTPVNIILGRLLWFGKLAVVLEVCCDSTYTQIKPASVASPQVAFLSSRAPRVQWFSKGYDIQCSIWLFLPFGHAAAESLFKPFGDASHWGQDAGQKQRNRSSSSKRWRTLLRLCLNTHRSWLLSHHSSTTVSWLFPGVGTLFSVLNVQVPMFRHVYYILTLLPYEGQLLYTTMPSVILVCDSVYQGPIPNCIVICFLALVQSSRFRHCVWCFALMTTDGDVKPCILYTFLYINLFYRTLQYDFTTSWIVYVR